MKTSIILQEGWKELISYDLLITLAKGDIIEHNSIEYKVLFCLLETHNNTMLIVVK